MTGSHVRFGEIGVPETILIAALLAILLFGYPTMVLFSLIFLGLPMATLNHSPVHPKL